MTIEVTERTIGIWYLHLNDTSDWMAGMWREDDGIHVSYRFRYYVDDLLDETSKDRKKWYSLTTTEPVPLAIAGIRELIEGMKDGLGAGRSWEILMGERNVEDFTKEFMSMPWTHVTKIEPDD